MTGVLCKQTLIISDYYVTVHGPPSVAKYDHEFINLQIKFVFTLNLAKRANPYYFSRANQQEVNSKIYSLFQCSLTVNGYD